MHKNKNHQNTCTCTYPHKHKQKKDSNKNTPAVAFCQDLLFQFRCHGQKQPLWGGLWEASHGRWFEDIPCSLDEPGPFLWSWLRWTVANQDALRGLAMKIWKSWWRRWRSQRSIRKISKAYSFHKSEVWQESILICGTCAPLREKRVNQPCGCVSNSEIPIPPLFFVEVLKIPPLPSLVVEQSQPLFLWEQQLVACAAGVWTKAPHKRTPLEGDPSPWRRR